MGGDLGEAVAELAAPLLVDVLIADWLVLAEFFDDVGLLPFQIFDLVAEGGDAGGGAVVDSRLFVLDGQEERCAVGAEDAAGEEPADGVEEFVFADPQAFGVGGVPGLAGVVGGYGFAGVVAVPVADAAGLAVQPPAAQLADDVGA